MILPKAKLCAADTGPREVGFETGGELTQHTVQPLAPLLQRKGSGALGARDGSGIEGQHPAGNFRLRVGRDRRDGGAFECFDLLGLHGVILS